MKKEKYKAKQIKRLSGDTQTIERQLSTNVRTEKNY